MYCIIHLVPDKSMTIWQMHLISRQENFLSMGALPKTTEKQSTEPLLWDVSFAKDMYAIYCKTEPEQKNCHNVTNNRWQAMFWWPISCKGNYALFCKWKAIFHNSSNKQPKRWCSCVSTMFSPMLCPTYLAFRTKSMLRFKVSANW